MSKVVDVNFFWKGERRPFLDALEDGASVGQARGAPGVADGGSDDHATAWPVKVPAAKREVGSTIRPAAS